jgi:hypothetical protein
MVQRHKKTRKTNLTASKKKQRRKASETRVECLDGLFDCLATIGTLADLLETTGRHPNAGPVEAATISHTGKLILAEVTKAHAWLDKLEEAAR